MSLNAAGYIERERVRRANDVVTRDAVAEAERVAALYDSFMCILPEIEELYAASKATRETRVLGALREVREAAYALEGKINAKGT